jgi:release factor glutamine methyltransferase
VSGVLEAPSVGAALCAATRCLKAAGVEQPRRDARLLLGRAAGLSPEALLARPDRALSTGEAAAFEALVARRAAREPVARILGTRQFWGLDFALSPDTLDPRPDSETLVEAALAHVADRQAALSALDLGTGTGCLLLAVLSELPRARGLGIDAAAGAVATARANAAGLGLAARTEFRPASWARPGWAQGLGGPFDLVLCNPPYVESGAELAPEVARFDPSQALFAGPDGLDAYRALLPALPSLLAPGGAVFLEIGAGQAAAVAPLARDAGFARMVPHQDLSGVPRCLALST